MLRRPPRSTRSDPLFPHPPLSRSLPGRRVFRGPARLPAAEYGRLGIEAEIAFRITSDLPPRDTPYTRSEVVAGVGAVCAAIEVVDRDRKSTRMNSSH